MLLFCMYTNPGQQHCLQLCAASGIKYSMVLSSRYSDVSVVAKYTHSKIDVTLYIEYLIDRIFNTNTCLFAFTSVACSTFNFLALSANFNTIY